jgi:uncharacterized protein YbcC (UPF0753/DUF2309 family)
MPITASLIEMGMKQALKAGRSMEEKAQIDKASYLSRKIHVDKDVTLHDWVEAQVTAALDTITKGGYSAASKEVEALKASIVDGALRKIGLK